ncbi:MAG: glycosyltransferase [Gemmatimonadales bacterium]
MNSRPLSIIIVSWHFPPSSEVAGKAVWRLARALTVRGVRVRVLTPPASEAVAVDAAYGASIPAGMKVERVDAWRDPVRAAVEWKRRRRQGSAVSANSPLPDPKKPTDARPVAGGLARRMIGATRFPDHANRWIVPASRRLRQLLRDEPTDLVISVSPLVSAHLAVRLGGVPRGATRWFAWVHDPLSDNPYFADRGWAAAILGRIEAMIARRASRVLVTTHALGERLERRYAMPPPVVLPCSYAAEELPPRQPATVRAHGQLVMAHVGTLYGHRSPVPILESLARLRGDGRLDGDDIRIRFVGSFEVAGESLDVLIARLGLLGIVTAEPPVSQADALRVLSEADCGLLLAEGQPLQVPAKTFEYIGMRKPIFALADGATAELVMRDGIGIACGRDQLDEALLALVAAWQSTRFAEFTEALDVAAARYEAGQVAQDVIYMLGGESGSTSVP